MSRKFRKGITSLQRFYTKISKIKPSALAVSVLIIAIVVFLFSGGIYDLTMRPLPSAYYRGSFLFVHPALSEQFISDSIVAMTLYALGVAGLLIMYQSTKYPYKPRQAYIMFLMGAVLLFLAYVFIEVTINFKLHG
ncbi:hypothetical protein CW708_02430 [Candidatus Bathyarchaeota archaeon]|nr:MAG: hypothetical protein CW708_02430 [Candidatus Bathyarchaeota archaeon]